MIGLRGALSISALAALCLTTGMAQADPAAEARFHDELARSHYQARRFEAALREFFLEQRISPNPRIAFNIALCFQELKQPEEAFLYFNEYLAGADQDAERRSYAERTIEALKPRLARLLVTSKPAGAHIFIDRKEFGSYGQTPKVVAIAPGEHEIILELEGYRAATAKIASRRGEQVAIELSPVRIVGTLKVSARVKGRGFVRDAAGETLAHGELPFEATLPPGSYEVSVHAPGHLPWSTLSRVEADARAEVSAAPQPAPAKTGDITVTSNVPGALIEVNGEPAGFSPTVLSNLAVGSHNVKLRTPGRLPWLGKVAVNPDQRAWLTVSLQEPPVVRRSVATWIVGGAGAAALITSGVLFALAVQAHDDFESAPARSNSAVLRERGLALNRATGVALITTGVAAGATLALYLATGERRGDPSSASLSQSKR